MELTVRRRIALGLASAVAAASLAVTAWATPAMADDGATTGVMPATTEDQYFSFWFEGFGSTQGTPGAPKEDTTPSYVNVDNMTIYDVFFYIDGEAGTNNWINQTVGGYAYMVDPGKYAIHNTVYENGMRSARMTAMANESGVLGGQWSPDSWGSYPSLN